MTRRLIDADELIKVLRNSHESHANNSREESLLARDIRLVEEQAKYHPVIPEEMKRQRFHLGRLIHPRFGEQDCIYDDARQIYFFDSVTKELMVKYGWKWEEADNE